MFLHDSAFWFCVFFLLGIFLISVFKVLPAVILVTFLIALYFLIFRRHSLVLLSFLIVAGALYYQVSDYYQKSVSFPVGLKTEFTGIIKSLERTAGGQKLVLELQKPYSGKIQANTDPYQSFQYGDLVKVAGIINRPSPESADYLAKNGILGTMRFSKIDLIESGLGNPIKARLLDFKNSIVVIFKRALPSEKAAFLSGLTLGEREDFSKELQRKMSLSGTTHLVALSGYNISIIALATAAIFGLYFSQSTSFYLSILVIVLFVLMTGGEASVVRAAIMGIIAILAKETERIFSIRNAIIVAAFLMVLYNPKVLVFDLGFQLSFAALLGIVYLLPVLKKNLKFKDSGFLSWKENILTALSAQLAVVPLLLGNFGTFSLTSLFSNVLIAEAVPLTMGLGFMMAGLGFISDFLAQMIGLIVNLLLSYELWIIDIFSKFSLPIATRSFGFSASIIYYALLIGWIVYYERKRV
ncbi:MAG: ComEC/Rec2 family competence protein [Candidatus Harrisonbacteria bacterium]|nr:ComEC/Rec2 family competence protein [Candidatus Harrisonbacteria bacterium]